VLGVGIWEVKGREEKGERGYKGNWIEGKKRRWCDDNTAQYNGGLERTRHERIEKQLRRKAEGKQKERKNHHNTHHHLIHEKRKGSIFSNQHPPHDTSPLSREKESDKRSLRSQWLLQHQQ